MDINFHYFAVKTMAHFAGFQDFEAQRIAEFSQYIDDCNWASKFQCANIPGYVKYEEYDLVVSSDTIKPVQTGFVSMLDYAKLILESNQKFIVSPFHFVAYDRYCSSRHYRTKPLTPWDNSMIDRLIWRAISEYADQVKHRKNTQMSLMQLGMLLHTFADTYAHQLFSGYRSWVNEVKVTHVHNNITGKDVTEMALADLAAQEEENGIIPAIGHAQAGSTPDLTHVSFEMDYMPDEDGTRMMKYRRSNTEEFLVAARHIYTYLGKCKFRPDVSDEEWQPIAERLRRGFLVEMPKDKDQDKVAAKLADHCSLGRFP